MSYSALQAAQRGQAEAAPSVPPGAYRARVVQAPAAAGEPLLVEHVNSTDRLQDAVTRWTRRVLPAVGDECLVAYDDGHEPWIVAWATPESYVDLGGGGGGAGNLFIQQTDPALDGATGTFLWAQTDGAGNLVTIWVHT